MKKTIGFAILSLSLLLAACGSSGGSSITAVEKGKKIEDIHGVGVSKEGITYVATHEGLFSTKEAGGKWNKVGSASDDFMGFHMRSDGTMMTSGHPGNHSDYPNPMGILISKDKGLHWKTVEYTGKIDFHILTTYHHDPNVIFGLNQMGTGEYGAGIYKSTDNGKNWTKIEPKGLPEDFMKIYSLLILPEDPNTLLAGTDMGVMISKDGGKNWDMFDNSRLITTMTVMPNGKDLVAYCMTNTSAGVMISKNSGQTWENLGLNLGKDAASSISVNQTNEKQIAVSTFSTSLYETKDGGGNWQQMIKKGILK